MTYDTIDGVLLSVCVSFTRKLSKQKKNELKTELVELPRITKIPIKHEENRNYSIPNPDSKIDINQSMKADFFLQFNFVDFSHAWKQTVDEIKAEPDLEDSNHLFI